MSQTIIQVENLNLAYKDIHAVQNVSFSVKSGEILAIIGQNGSGKTSTVECIEGLRKPDSGIIHVFGKDPGCIAAKFIKKWAFNCKKQNIFQKSRLQNYASCLRVFMKNPLIGIYY